MHRNNKLILFVKVLLIIAIIFQFSITGLTTIDLICIDTDSGENPLEQGTTQGYKWTMFGYQQTEPVQDKCIPFDESEKNRVREYYCSKHRVARKNIRCPETTTCIQGACVPL